MQNQFSLYSKSSARQDKLQTKEINGEHYLNQDYTNSNQIWDIFKPIKIIKELIDWNNWWFYENKDKNLERVKGEINPIYNIYEGLDTLKNEDNKYINKFISSELDFRLMTLVFVTVTSMHRS